MKNEKNMLSDEDLEFVSGGATERSSIVTYKKTTYDRENLVVSRTCPACGNAYSVERDGHLYCTACGGLTL